jgi:hypothetical protein
MQGIQPSLDGKGKAMLIRLSGAARGNCLLSATLFNAPASFRFYLHMR